MEHTQQNKLFKCRAKNSQNCPFGGGPATEPLSNIPELGAKQIAKWEATEGLLDVLKYLYEEFEGFVVELSLAEFGRQTECWDLR